MIASFTHGVQMAAACLFTIALVVSVIACVRRDVGSNPNTADI